MTRSTLRHLVLATALILVPATAPGAQAGIAEVNGVRLPYEITGTGQPLVLIHGWAVHRGYWEANVPALSRRFRVIRYDRRGFGDATGKPDLTADAADLKALLAALAIPRAHLLGHSQGTAVALTAAVRFPEIVDAIVLVGPAPPAGFTLPAGRDTPPFGAFLAAGRTHGVDSLRAAIGAGAATAFGDSLPPDVAAGVGDLLAKYSGADLLDPAPPLHLADPATVDELGAVRAPTLILLGERDMAPAHIVADVLAYGIPDARKHVLAGGGHAINLSRPGPFVETVTRFLLERGRR